MMKVIGIISLFLLLVGCSSGGLSAPEGEELAHEEAQDIIQQSIEAEQDISSVQMEVVQELLADFGGFFGLFADEEEYRTEHTVIAQDPEEIYVHSRVYESTQQGIGEEESDEPTSEVEMIIANGMHYRETNASGWQDLGEYEPEEETLEDQYDYYDVILNMSGDQYQMVEQEEYYVVFVEATSAQQAEQLESLLLGTEEGSTDRAQTFLEYGLDYFAFLFEIDKETLLPHSFEIAMSGGDTVDRERVSWEQTLTGSYSNYDEAFAVESPFTPGFERPVALEEEPEEPREEEDEDPFEEIDEEEEIDPNSVVIGLVNSEELSEQQQIEFFQENHQDWIAAIEEATGTMIEFEIHDQESDVVNELIWNQSNVDIGIVEPEVYLEVSDEGETFDPLVADFITMQLVVREDLGIESVEELVDRAIAIIDRESLADYIAMRYQLLQEYGLDIDEEASIYEMETYDIVANNLNYSDSPHDAALIPSFFTEVDLMEEDMIVLAEIEVPTRVFVTGPDFPNERREQVREALEGHYGFRETEDSDFDGLREVVDYFDIEYEW